MSGPTKNHTVRRYDAELQTLKQKLQFMGHLVSSQLSMTLAALRQHDPAVADTVIQRDREVDHIEVELDAEVIDLLACLAPVGSDLRLVMMISKSVSDLEHIGDEVCKIAALGRQIYRGENSDPSAQLLLDVHEMGHWAMGNLEEVLAIFDRQDLGGAKALIESHPSLDQKFQAGLRRLMTYVMQDPRSIGHVVDAVSMTKALERIGDYAKNIAECVIYLVEGEDIRDVPPELS